MTDLPPACKLCAGACCSGVALDPVKLGLPRDVVQWWRMHGEPSAFGTWLNCPCRHLKDGKCEIHDGPSMPQMCKDWKVGGPECRQCVKECRPKQWRQIFGLMPPREY